MKHCNAAAVAAAEIGKAVSRKRRDEVGRLLVNRRLFTSNTDLCSGAINS